MFLKLLHNYDALVYVARVVELGFSFSYETRLLFLRVQAIPQAGNRGILRACSRFVKKAKTSLVLERQRYLL
jgi:hypothetical protein